MEFISSLHPIIASMLWATIFIAIWGLVDYALNNRKTTKAEKETRDTELENLIQEIANCREEARSLLIDYKREKDKVASLEKSSNIEKEDLNNTIEDLKLKLTEYQAKEKLAELKPKPKPRVDKYSKPNTLYIAYDFNISGNQSYAKVLKHITTAANNEIRPAVKTTSILFFNYLYTPVFEDIILVKKNGSSISIKKLYDNPGYYIDEKSSLFSIIINDRGILTDLNYILIRIAGNEIKFVKEKEL